MQESLRRNKYLLYSLFSTIRVVYNPPFYLLEPYNYVVLNIIGYFNILSLLQTSASRLLFIYKDQNPLLLLNIIGQNQYLKVYRILSSLIILKAYKEERIINLRGQVSISYKLKRLTSLLYRTLTFFFFIFIIILLSQVYRTLIFLSSAFNFIIRVYLFLFIIFSNLVLY